MFQKDPIRQGLVKVPARGHMSIDLRDSLCEWVEVRFQTYPSDVAVGRPYPGGCPSVYSYRAGTSYIAPTWYSPDVKWLLTPLRKVFGLSE
jgi:hypothetical protein